MGEGDRQVVERGIDLRYEVLQVLADPLELEIGESGEDKACRRRRTLAFLVRHVRVISRRLE
jgi:hypothetical protein